MKTLSSAFGLVQRIAAFEILFLCSLLVFDAKTVLMGTGVALFSLQFLHYRRDQRKYM